METGQWPDRLPRKDPWTPHMDTLTLAMSSAMAYCPLFPEAKASGCWTQSLPLSPTRPLRLPPIPGLATGAESPMIIQKQQRLTPVHLEIPRGPLFVSPRRSPGWGGPWRLLGIPCPMANLAFPPLPHMGHAAPHH